MLHFIYMIISFGLGVYFILSGAVTFSFIGRVAFLLTFTLVGYISLFLVQLLIFVIIGSTINVNKLPKTIDTIYRRYGLATLKVFVDSFRIKVDSTGLEKLPNEPFLLVSNHRSFFDPLVGIELFKKHNLAWISKEENMRIPAVGKYMFAVGCIPINRSSTKEAIKSINKAAEYIKTGYCSIGIYPEGKENKVDDIPLLPFRDGAFKIAKKACCPVVVTTIKNSRHVFKSFMFRPIHIKIDVLDVIDKDTVKSLKTPELSKLTSDIMLENLI